MNTLVLELVQFGAIIFCSPKSQFLGVFGAPNEFFWTPMPFWTSKLMVWGVILLIILDLSFGFWSYFLAKQAIKNFSNQQLLEY